MVELVEEAHFSSKMAPDETRFIYLDKAHSVQQGALATSQLIDQNIPWGIPYSKLYLIPEFDTEQMKTYPFTYEFNARAFCNSMNQFDNPCIAREAILSNFSVELKHFLDHKNVHFDPEFLKRRGLQNYLRVPMADIEARVPYEFMDAVNMVMEEDPPPELADSRFGRSSNFKVEITTDKVINLIRVINKYSYKFN